MSIHPTAVIDPTARIDDAAEIGPYAVIGAEVEIGPRCRIGPHAAVLDYVRLGEGCDVYAHAVLGGTPQDLKFRGVVSYVDIGPGCVIREGATVHRGTREGTATVVGRNCFLMANSHVGHNARLGEGVILANGALLAGDVEVGDRAFLSGNVVVHQFVRIGPMAMLAGGCAIGLDVLPCCTTVAAERNRIAGLNVVGMRRAGVGPEERRLVRRAFEIVFRSGFNRLRILERLRTECVRGPAAEWADFIEGSRRGVCFRTGSRRGGAEEPDE